MRVFITGATGFIGSHIVRLLLKQGYKITALVRPQSKLNNLKGLKIDIAESDLNDQRIGEKMQGCQYLFHVAAHYSLWQKDRDLLYRYNVEGTRNILTAAQQAGIEKTIYTSSVAAIGVGKPGEIVDETHQSPVEKLIGDYKKSKLLAEKIALEKAEQGQNIVIVNPTSPIGALDIKPTPTGDIILRFLNRKMPAYVDTGLNFIDVEDVAWGHLLALEKGKVGDRYILGNQNLSLKQLLEKLSEITNIPAPKTVIPHWIPLTVAWIDETILAPLGKIPTVPLDGVRMAQQKMYYDSSKAVRELGIPQSSLDIALKNAVNWFIANGYVDR